MEAAKKHFNLVVSDMEVSIETTPKIAASEPEKIQVYMSEIVVTVVTAVVVGSDFNV